MKTPADIATHTRPPVVRAVWLDAEGEDEWQNLDDVAKRELPLVETVGFLVVNKKGFIGVAGSMDFDNDQAQDVTLIPRGMLQDLIELEPKGDV